MFTKPNAVSVGTSSKTREGHNRSPAGLAGGNCSRDYDIALAAELLEV